MRTFDGAAVLRAAAGIPIVGLLLLSGCTEEALTGVDPDTAPGDAGETMEIELSAADLPLWRDTTFTGFALPATSGTLPLAESADLRARVLARFSTIPDSLFIDPDRLAIERYESGRLRIVIDTTASSVADSGVQLTLYSTSRSFEEREASWSEAAAGDPWTTPGGDLGDVLGTLRLDSLSADTVFLDFDVDTDSLLTAWGQADGETGVALLSETAGSSLTLRQVALSFDAKPAGRDTLVAILRAAAPATFIFDPETPPPSGVLRIGGLPAARMYATFRLPEAIDGSALRGARINRATLLLTANPAPDAPFTAQDTTFASGFSLLADPFEFGPKVPVGLNFGTSVPLPPEELEDGGEVGLNVTAVIQVWAVSDPDSMPDISIAVRMLPEGGGLPFWDFANGTDPSDAPRLRILFTPPTPFNLP